MKKDILLSPDILSMSEFDSYDDFNRLVEFFEFYKYKNVIYEFVSNHYQDFVKEPLLSSYFSFINNIYRELYSQIFGLGSVVDVFSLRFLDFTFMLYKRSFYYYFGLSRGRFDVSSFIRFITGFFIRCGFFTDRFLSCIRSKLVSFDSLDLDDIILFSYIINVNNIKINYVVDKNSIGELKARYLDLDVLSRLEKYKSCLLFNYCYLYEFFSTNKADKDLCDYIYKLIDNVFKFNELGVPNIVSKFVFSHLIDGGGYTKFFFASELKHSWVRNSFYDYYIFIKKGINDKNMFRFYYNLKESVQLNSYLIDFIIYIFSVRVSPYYTLLFNKDFNVFTLSVISMLYMSRCFSDKIVYDVFMSVYDKFRCYKYFYNNGDDFLTNISVYEEFFSYICKILLIYNSIFKFNENNEYFKYYKDLLVNFYYRAYLSKFRDFIYSFSSNMKYKNVYLLMVLIVNYNRFFDKLEESSFSKFIDFINKINHIVRSDLSIDDSFESNLFHKFLVRLYNLKFRRDELKDYIDNIFYVDRFFLVMESFFNSDLSIDKFNKNYYKVVRRVLSLDICLNEETLSALFNMSFNKVTSLLRSIKNDFI